MSDISVSPSTIVAIATPVLGACVAGIVAMWHRMITVEDRAAARIKEIEAIYAERIGEMEEHLGRMRDELRSEIKKSASALLLARDALASRYPDQEHSEVTFEDAAENTAVSAEVLPAARAQIIKMARAEIERNRSSNPPPRPKMKSRY